jgi:peptide/nickel transport system substrate-binding protein
MKTRTLWLVISFLVIASVTLASCGPKTSIPDTSIPNTPIPNTPIPNTPTSTGSYLTINFEQVSTWVRNFNPFSPDALGSTNTALYEPMMIYNKSIGELVPWLATGYSWSADNITLTFKIREGVKWSDGQPFTAKDVLFTFDMLRNNPALSGSGSGVLSEYVDSFTSPDDYTIVFNFKSIYTAALYDIANQIIVPEHIWKDVQDPLTWTNDNPVASGPFTEITKFEAQIYVLEKNPYYWQAGKPYFQGIRYPAFADNDAANLALAKGELDWAGNFVPDIENTYVAKDPTNFHYYFVGGDAVLLYINLTLKPFDRPEVRKAISMGIDRQMIVETAMFNYVPPADATGLGDTYSVWKDPAAVAAGTWVNYDAAAANAALDAAGLTKGSDGIRVDQDGKQMKYTLIVPSGWTDWISAAQIITQNMGDLGITITLDTPEENTDITQVSQGDFEWAILWGSGGPTPYNFYRGQMSKISVLPVGEVANENFLRYVNPEADTLLEQFAKTSDIAQQKQIINQIEMLFVNNAPALPLFPGPDWYEYNTTRFTGFPSADDPYAPGVPYGNSPYNTPLIILTTIKPK